MDKREANRLYGRSTLSMIKNKLQPSPLFLFTDRVFPQSAGGDSQGHPMQSVVQAHFSIGLFASNQQDTFISTPSTNIRLTTDGRVDGFIEIQS